MVVLSRRNPRVTHEICHTACFSGLFLGFLFTNIASVCITMGLEWCLEVGSSSERAVNAYVQSTYEAAPHLSCRHW